jgi:hypothetical protein
MAGNPPAQTPPSKNRNSGHIITIWIATLIVVAVCIVAIFFYIYSQPSNDGQTGPAPPTFWISYAAGNGSRTTDVPLAWGLTSPLPCTACQTINFTVSATSGLGTDKVGLKILSKDGNPISTAWVAILWLPEGSEPLAAYSGATGAWTAAAGHTLPIYGLQDTGLMIISTTTISGQGNTLRAIGTNGGSVESDPVTL